jgi:micrococcal nuclease
MRVLLCLLLCVTCVTQVYAYPALVISVHDGDTIRVRRGNSEIERVRLASIDAPELKQPMGLAARSLTEQLTLGRTVQISEKGHDRYGRVVANVTAPNGVNVSCELVRRGLAWWYQDFDPYNVVIANLQTRARKKRLGIWAGKNQVAPWEYRRALISETSSSTNKGSHISNGRQPGAGKQIGAALKHVQNDPAL